MQEAEIFPVPAPEYSVKEMRNACSYGPNLEKYLTPPTFDVTYKDGQMISMCVGSDVLHPEAKTYDVSSVAEFYEVASMRLNMIGKLNKTMARCSIKELQQLKFTPSICSIYTCALNPDPVKQMYADTWVPKQLANQTFAASVVRASMEVLSKDVSAFTMQCMPQHFVAPYFEALQSSEGSIKERVARALTIATTRLALADINPQDINEISSFAKSIPAMVEAGWNQRNEQILLALQETGLPTMLPEKHSATFKHDYINNINHLLGENTWNGDVSLMYRAAESACRAAFRQAMRNGDYESAGAYVAIQGACMKEINNLKNNNNNKDNNNDVMHHEHDREYQKYEQNEPEQEVTPEHDDTEDITIDWR